MTHPIPQDMSSQGVPEVEQAPRVRIGYRCTVGGPECPGHISKWLMCGSGTQAVGVWPEEVALWTADADGDPVIPGASVEERTDQCPTCGSLSPAEHPVVTLDDGGDEDGEVVDRCLNPWHVFAEEPLGGAAALRADVAKSVLNATADLRELLESMGLAVDWPSSYREALAGLDRIERQVRGERQ